jgi:hypothetical protein
MEKMFVHYSGTVAQFKDAGLETKYTNSIVFIKGGTDGNGVAVYTHGKYYADSQEVSSLAAVVNGLKIIKGIKVGDSEKEAKNHNGIIEFSSDDPVTLAVTSSDAGVKFGLTSTFVSKVDTASTNAANAVSRLDTLENTTIPGVAGRVEALEESINDAENGLSATVAAQGQAIEQLGQVDAGLRTDVDKAAQAAAKAAQDAIDKANAAQSAAKTYTDGEIDKVEQAYAQADSELKNELKGYADQAETDAVNTAKGYTNDEIGKLSAVYDPINSASTAKAAVIGVSGDASSADTIYGAKKYADEKASAAQSAAISAAASDATSKANTAESNAIAHANAEIAKLDADVTSAEGTKVRVQVVEVDGKITAVNVSESDIASATEFNKIKEDVEYFLGDALNKENAEAVKDTLKEIQDYLGNDTTGVAGMLESIRDNKEAAEAAQSAADKAQGEVDALEGVVAGVKSTADAAATKEALQGEVDRAKGIEQGLQSAIDTLNGDATKAGSVAKAVADAKSDLEGQISGKVSNSTYATDKANLESAISTAEGNAKGYADSLAKNYDAAGSAATAESNAKTHAQGLINALDVTDVAVDGEYVSAVSETDGKISVSRKALPVYTLATGSANGTVAFNGSDVAVKGLGSAAYTESSAYATSAQGAKADKAAEDLKNVYTKTEVDTTLGGYYTKTQVDALFGWEEL